jgi:hypothetical protein
MKARLLHHTWFIVLSLSLFSLCSVQRTADSTASFDSIIIRAGSYAEKVIDALTFLREYEPASYRLTNRYIHEIGWEGNPFWSLTHFPDRISLSTSSFGRGEIYLASLIFHELHHILFMKIRLSTLSKAEFREISEYYRQVIGFDVGRVAQLSRYDEELLIHRFQLHFLERHRDYRSVELQKVIIENLPRTYYHLKR